MAELARTEGDRIVRTYYWLAGLYTLAASMIWPVNTLFLLDAGLSIGEVFVANACFSAGMVLFEIPTGVVADTRGRRLSYLASVTILAATTLLYLWAAQAEAGVVVFSLISIVMGLGFTFYSGALEAWLVDALHSVSAGDDLDHVFARSQQATGAAMLGGTIVGGLLGQIDLAVPFVARSVVLVLVFAVAARTMFDRGFEPRPLRWARIPAELSEQTRVGVAYGWNQRGLRMLMLSGMARGAFLGWAFYAAQPYLLELLDSDAIWIIGFFNAAVAISTMVGNELVEHLTRRCGRRSTLLILGAMATTLGGVVVGLTDEFWVAVIAFLVMTGAMGVMGPVRQAYVHHETPADHRATVISFDAMVGSVGGVGGQLGLGRVADTYSLSAGYVVGGLLTALSWPFLFALRRQGGEADRIAGRHEGYEGTCAAQGLPRNVSVESHPAEVLAESRAD
ncbi:MAG: MFS transporter [Acidimicrobiia bacterium]|nr:MFS transporter [Acidimicrobiia bacterium]